MRHRRTISLAIGALAGIVLGLVGRALDLSGLGLALFWGCAVAAVVLVLVPWALGRRPRRVEFEVDIWSTDPPWLDRTAPTSPNRVSVWYDKRLIWERSEYRSGSGREFEWRGSTYDRPSQPVETRDQNAYRVALPARVQGTTQTESSS